MAGYIWSSGFQYNDIQSRRLYVSLYRDQPDSPARNIMLQLPCLIDKLNRLPTFQLLVFLSCGSFILPSFCIVLFYVPPITFTASIPGEGKGKGVAFILTSPSLNHVSFYVVLSINLFFFPPAIIFNNPLSALSFI